MVALISQLALEIPCLSSEPGVTAGSPHSPSKHRAVLRNLLPHFPISSYRNLSLKPVIYVLLDFRLCGAGSYVLIMARREVETVPLWH